MGYDDIRIGIENYFKNIGYEPKFGDDDDYRNMVEFWVEDNNKMIIIPKCKILISKISTTTLLEKYLQWLKSHYNLV